MNAAAGMSSADPQSCGILPPLSAEALLCSVLGLSLHRCRKDNEEDGRNFMQVFWKSLPLVCQEPWHIPTNWNSSSRLIHKCNVGVIHHCGVCEWS